MHGAWNMKIDHKNKTNRFDLRSLYLTLFFLSACEMVEAEEEKQILNNAVEPASRSYTFSSRPMEAPSAGIEQIDIDAVESTQQLSAGGSGASVEQLQEYVDLCAPEIPRREDINCDQMKLKMREKYNSDDELFEALKKLDQLTRGQKRRSLLEGLEGNGENLSTEAMAIAGGLIPVQENTSTTEEGGVEVENLEAIEAIIIPNLNK